MGDLIEREVEVAALHDVLASAAEGTGQALLVSGPAGIGKSALLEQARRAARVVGFKVLWSSPRPVSTSLAHTVVRDWLGQELRAAPPGTPPFDGPASALAQALRDPTGDHAVWSLASLDYAVTWVLEALSETQPLLLVVDDVQWADVASLQLLDLLSARLPQMSAALLIAQRTGEPLEAPGVLTRLTSRASHLTPAPLSVIGVEQLRRSFAAQASGAPRSASELHRLTGGVPFLVEELLRAPASSEAPRGVVDSLRERLHRLGPEAVAIARTTAVLGELATFDAVAEVVGVSVADIAGPLEVLADAAIIELGMWRAWPAHPLITEAIVSGMSTPDRSRLHRSVADHLTRSGASPAAVAGQLLHTLPREDPEVVTVLRSVGEAALRDGSPEIAARMLRRAAEETRPEDTDPDLLAAAGSAHLLAGLGQEGHELWQLALERVTEPTHLARLLAERGRLHVALGERTEAATAYRRAVEVLTGAGHDATSEQLRGVLVRVGLTRALYEGARSDIVSAVREATRQPAGNDTHDDRLLFTLASVDVARRGADRERAEALALRALGAGTLLEEETSDGFGFYMAAGVLGWCDAYGAALAELEAAVDDARRRGSVGGFATATYCRGLIRYRAGRLKAASADFDSALELRRRGWTDFGAGAVTGAALTHVGLGEHETALRLEPALRAAGARSGFLSAPPLAAAGVVRAVHGDHLAALDDYRTAAKLLGDYADNPSIVEWRELSVWSLMALDRRSEAEALAEEALTNARTWGAPRALSFALRTAARASDPDRAEDLLREAVRLLEESGTAVDYLARTRTDLGALLLHGTVDPHEEAVSLLRAVIDYGRAAGVEPVANRATRLLVRAGVAVTDPAVDRSRALTTGERRVAELAAAGASNREIAQQLFVTVKAVEWHLSNSYRKLGIKSRRQLRAALYDTDAAASSSDM